MAILRYTCTQCGIITRVEEGDDFRACACRAAYDIVNEETEAAAAANPPSGE